MKIFIGSSKENEDTLDDISEFIESLGHEPIPWNKPGLFLAGKYTGSRLLEIAKNEIDASIMLFSPDDKIWYRGNEKLQARDNVIYEYGLFSGILGFDKSILVTSGQKSKIPTDLSGLSYIDFNKKRRARIELKSWLKHINSREKYTSLSNNNQIFTTYKNDFEYFLSYQDEMRDPIMDFISDLYWNYELEEYTLKDYSTYFLTKFINDFIGISDARFTLRKYNRETNFMETYLSTREDKEPGPIPINKTNMISESAKRNKPLIYSENKEFHYSSNNNSLKKGIYFDYVSYCLLENENNVPEWSICLDVKNNTTAINRMKFMVHSLVFEIACLPIIEKILIEIQSSENLQL